MKNNSDDNRTKHILKVIDENRAFSHCIMKKDFPFHAVAKGLAYLRSISNNDKGAISVLLVVVLIFRNICT